MPKRFALHLLHNVVAYLALFFALGGTALAAKPLITGADVQDGSLTGADISDNSTLKGVDIDESDLGKVPSAVNADTLDGKHASELGGATSFDYTLDEAPVDEVVTLMPLENGLVLQARCRQPQHENSRFTQVAVIVANEATGFTDRTWEAYGTLHYDGNVGPSSQYTHWVSMIDSQDGSDSNDPFDRRLWLNGVDTIVTKFIVRAENRVRSDSPKELCPWALLDVIAKPPDRGAERGKCSITGTVTYPGGP